MRIKDIENGLALAGAILVLIGVSFAATSALAAENAGITVTGVAIHKAAETSIEHAAIAHAEAADVAVRRIARSNELDLDIRFFDHNSTLVARR